MGHGELWSAQMLAAVVRKVATPSVTSFVSCVLSMFSHIRFIQYLLLCDIFFPILQNGVDCNWMDTRKVLIVTPTSSNQVDPDYVESGKRLEKWYSENPSKTIIATGFIASTSQDIPTTLKRDGSDFSAAIMGALFKARQVTIWTDVDGVYSADPRKGFCLSHLLAILIARNISRFHSSYVENFQAM